MRARQWVVMAGVWTMLGAAQLAHGATPETFDRSEGLNLNRFVRQGEKCCDPKIS